MITRLAVEGYRSIRSLVLELGPLTLITGPNGAGKSNLYRALRLLSHVAQDRLTSSLAVEGGLASALWAGPEKISRAMKSGEHPVQGTRRSRPISLRLGFSGDDLGYAIDLGLPTPGSVFPQDPEIKVEAMWSGGQLGRANLFAERRGQMVRLRRADTGGWRDSFAALAPTDSMVTRCAHPEDGLELLQMRERMLNWRFYDNLRTDQDAPARRPQVWTYTPVLASDGADLAAAIGTITALGNGAALAQTVENAFPGSQLSRGDGADGASIVLHQRGLLRPLTIPELSDGTLRYLLLCAALLSPRLPEIMVLNEPEASLHPTLMAPLADLLRRAARRCQLVVVSHSSTLVEALGRNADVTAITLGKDTGETVAADACQTTWTWPTR